jgi:hypothetical protein
VTLAHRFPFGRAPAPVKEDPTGPVPPPNPQATALLVDFVPPTRALPFRAPSSSPAPPSSPTSLVPLLPGRPVVRSRVSFRNGAGAVLLVLDLAVLVYLAATWGR